jgi:hypothetical protein
MLLRFSLLLSLALLPLGSAYGDTETVSPSVESLCALSGTEPATGAGLGTTTDYVQLLAEACERISRLGGTCENPGLADAANTWAWGLARSRQVLSIHEVTLAPGTFVLMPFDEQRQMVELALDLGASVGRGLQIRTMGDASPVFFPIAVDTLEAYTWASSMGQLGVRLVFEPAGIQTPRSPLCVTDEHGVTTLTVHPLEVELFNVQDGSVFSMVRGTSWSDARVRTGAAPSEPHLPAGLPRAKVHAVRSECERAELGDGAVWLQMMLEATMSLCYLDALPSNYGLHGAMTLGVEIDASGQVSAPELLIDAIDSEDLHTCLQEMLPQLTIPASMVDGNVDVVVNVSYELCSEL